jgi:NAD(P)-dependent dehydrogenase (short-subunit alcohol dehydrogenase family)
MKKVILITGISSGFGKETAALLAERGHVVYGTVRKAGSMNDKVNVLQMDVTDEASVKSAVDTVFSKEGRIDVLINNAGMHIGGPAETTPMEHIKLIMDTNFLGLVRVTRAVLPYMRKQEGGTIINFSSIGGLIGLPFVPYYSASKFAIEGFSESLRIELLQFNIKVVVINPGDFRTNSTSNRKNYLAPTGENDPYFRNYSRALASIEKDEAKGWDPGKMAIKISKIVDCKNPSPRYKIGDYFQRITPNLKKIIPESIVPRLVALYYNIK